MELVTYLVNYLVSKHTKNGNISKAKHDTKFPFKYSADIVIKSDYMYIQDATIFPKMYKRSRNSARYNGDVKQIPY